jgi:hypothetical protein
MIDPVKRRSKNVQRRPAVAQTWVRRIRRRRAARLGRGLLAITALPFNDPVEPGEPSVTSKFSWPASRSGVLEWKPTSQE